MTKMIYTFPNVLSFVSSTSLYVTFLLALLI